MREYKASTKRGQELIATGERCTAKSLSELYNRCSDAKCRAYRNCLELYLNGTDSTAFGVGNANTFGFTASWLARIEGEQVMRIETKCNSYLVWLER